MSNFYLDIIKDRLYTMKEDSPARRSAQTAQYHISEALVRWIAPILSFTANEIWQAIPGDRVGSVFTAEWYAFPEEDLASSFNDAYWQDIAKIKTAVNRAIEQKRKDGSVGGALTTNITLYCSDSIKTKLEQLKNELRFVLICSSVTLLPMSEKGEASEVDGLRIYVEKSAAGKCVRCWHHREDVGSNKTHLELCGRCIDNVDGKGEQREFV
jgi:isoleucyl-tRNA synthetase